MIALNPGQLGLSSSSRVFNQLISVQRSAREFQMRKRSQLELRTPEDNHSITPGASCFISYACSCMPDHSGYQPLSQAVDDEEADVGEGSQASPRRGLRRSSRPRHIDLGKLDTAFKRFVRAYYQQEPLADLRQMDRVDSAQSQEQEEGSGQLAEEGDLA